MMSTNFCGSLRTRTSSASRVYNNRLRRRRDERLTKVSIKRVEVNVFDRRRQGTGPVLPTAPLRLSDANPAGGLITGSSKTISFDERFQERDRVVIFGLQVRSNPSCDTPQTIAGQNRDFD